MADELRRQEGFEVRVAYVPILKGRSLLPKNRSGVRRVPIPQLPYRRFGPVRRLNTLLGRAFLDVLALRWRPDIVTISHPTMLGYLPRSIRSTPLVYDCMDLAVEFSSREVDRAKVATLDVKAIRRAARIVAPSLTVLRYAQSRSVDPARCVLIRNGLSPFRQRSDPQPITRQDRDGRVLRLGYFGAISDWFDWELVLRLLDRDPRLEFHCWGPIDAAPPINQRIYVHHPVNREELPGATRAIDAFIMPFRLNALVRAVDPVKLYEYVALSRPAAAVSYPEIEHFAPFVFLYDGDEDVVRWLESIRVGEPLCVPSEPQRLTFLDSSSWHHRATAFAGVLLDAYRTGSPG